MDPSIPAQTAGGVVMVWVDFSWHSLSFLVPFEHHLDTAYLSIVADYVHPFMTTVSSSPRTVENCVMDM